MIDLSNQYTMEVLVNNRPIPEYPHTDGFVYVEGRDRSDYTIRLSNNSYERVSFVLAVDGLSVLTGDTDWSTGLVLAPREITEVKGWRINNGQIAKFEFSDVRKGYSTGVTGSASSSGVIGAMVFRERVMPIQANYTRGIFDQPVFGSIDNINVGTGMLYSSNSVTTGAAAVPDKLGTGWGDVAGASYINTTFTRRDEQNPDALLTIYYDSAKGLDRRGVVRPDKSSKYNPFPFPGYESALRGCKPPRN